MANAAYPLGRKAILDGDVDFLVNTISMQMYSGGAIYNATHDFLNDIAGTKAGSPVTLTGKTTTNGVFTATVPSFTPPAVTVIAVVLYKNTGSDATSTLLAWYDKKSDGTSISIVGDGTPITLSWTVPIYSIGEM